MRSILRGLLLMAVAGALSLASARPLGATTDGTKASSRKRIANPIASPAPPTRTSFDTTQLEFYLTDEGIGYIRPGLRIKVDSLVIGGDRRAVVELILTDDFDQPLDRLGRTTPGAISMSFVLAWYDPETRQYVSYTTRVQTTPANSPNPGVSAIQAAADSGGTFTDFSTGRSRYTFRTALPTGFDQSKTHTLGIYATRNLTAIIGKNYFFNVVHDFRPDGAAVTARWDKIRDVACAACHDPLALHGGSRRDVKLCVLCHQPQTSDPDTGNTVDMKVMVHKIHRGHNLPSVLAGIPYQIIGNQQSLHDFSHVGFPQDIRNCDNCHEAGGPAQSDVWYTKPSRDACGSCHDDINWATGANHPAGAQLDDNACASCHQPESELEFDASIKGAHTIPEKSKQLKGLTATIVSASNVAPGMKPTVVFRFQSGDGTPVDGTKLSTFAPILAGPTTSYAHYFRENALTRAVYDASTGLTSYTFTASLPADASGTWTFSGDIRRAATLKRGDGKPDIALQEAALNPIRYAAVSGPLTPRRTIVTTAKCNECHDRLALHGGQRLVVEECVICHNPLEGDQARRPAAAGAPESVSMQRLIHRIHRGEALQQDYTVYGFGGAPHNYNGILYPGDLRNCAKCHTPGSHNVPPAVGAANVTTLRDFFSPQGPGTAACLGCHDNRDAAAHAFLNTTTFGGSNTAEACGACHGSGSERSADRVHAR